MSVLEQTKDPNYIDPELAEVRDLAFLVAQAVSLTVRRSSVKGALLQVLILLLIFRRCGKRFVTES